MKPQTLFPYLRPFTSIQPQVQINGSTLIADQGYDLPSWHQAMETQVTAQLEINKKQILVESGLNDSSIIGLYLTSYSRSTKLKFVSELVKIEDESVKASLHIEPRSVGGVLELEVHLVCVERGQYSDELAPDSLDVLASWLYVVNLEGEDARANVQLTSFTGRKEKALWQIETKIPEDFTDWHFKSISSTFQVNLNRETYPRYLTDPIYQIGYGSEFLWEVLNLATSSVDVFEYVIKNHRTAPGSLIKCSGGLLEAIFGVEPEWSDVNYRIGNRASELRAELQEIATRVLGVKQ